MKHIISIFIFVFLSAIIYGQSVKSIQAEVVDNQIKIDFKISGLKYYQNIINIDLFVKKVGDDTFQGPMEFTSGDTKSGLKNGQHTILWDALKEMNIGKGELIFDIKILVEEEDRSRKTMLMLAGNQVTPFGIRIGQLGKTSWYIEARASLKAFENASYNFHDGYIYDYDQAGYYEISESYGWQAYSVIAGVTQQIHRQFYLYAGIGYGLENYLFEINNYTYESETSTGSSWVNYEKYSISGVEIDAGLIFTYKKFIISAGATAIDFKTFGWSGGLGIKF